MYRGTGAGRWAESSSGARGLPYKPPACARTAARGDEPEGTRSLPCWPCRAAAVAAVWTGMAKALRARPPLGLRSPLPRRQPQREGGGGGGIRGACPPLTWWPSAEAASGPWAEIDAAVMRGYSRPLRCG